MKRYLLKLCRDSLGLGAAVVITAGLFFVLPLMQAVAQAPEADAKPATPFVVRPVPPAPEVQPPPDETVDKPKPKPSVDSPDIDIDDLFPPSTITLRPGTPRITITPNIDPDTTVGPDEPGGFDQPPRPSLTTQPQISDAMRRQLRSRSVRVVVRCMVDEAGRVVEARVHSGDKTFDRSVLSAVKQWRFDPATRNGQPVVGLVSIPFDFPME